MAAEKNGKSLTMILVVIIVLLLVISIIFGASFISYKKGSLGKLTNKEIDALSKIEKDDIVSFISAYSDVDFDSGEEDIIEAVEEPFSDELSVDSLEEANEGVRRYQEAVNNAIKDPTTENYQKVLNFLDTGYVKNKGLNASNLSKVINKKIDFTITNLSAYYNDSYYIYHCNGIYVNPDDSEDVEDDYQMALVFSTEINLFAVLPNEALEDGSYNMGLNQIPNYTYSAPAKGDNDLELYYDDEIEEINGTTVLGKNYIKMFKLYAFINTEKAYNLLDETYRNKAYGDFEGFKNYVSSHSTEVYNLDIISCQYDQEKYESEASMFEEESENEGMDEELVDETYYDELSLFEDDFVCKDNSGKTLRIHQKKLYDFTISYDD